jgi:hypothetical protein
MRGIERRRHADPGHRGKKRSIRRRPVAAGGQDAEAATSAGAAVVKVWFIHLAFVDALTGRLVGDAPGLRVWPPSAM